MSYTRNYGGITRSSKKCLRWLHFSTSVSNCFCNMNVSTAWLRLSSKIYSLGKCLAWLSIFHTLCGKEYSLSQFLSSQIKNKEWPKIFLYVRWTIYLSYTFYHRSYSEQTWGFNHFFSTIPERQDRAKEWVTSAVLF